VNPLSDPALQETLKGVFRLVAPEIALLGTACVVFLFGCLYNRRWLWFAVSLIGVILAAILAVKVRTQMPPVITAARAAIRLSHSPNRGGQAKHAQHHVAWASVVMFVLP